MFCQHPSVFFVRADHAEARVRSNRESASIMLDVVDVIEQDCVGFAGHYLLNDIELQKTNASGTVQDDQRPFASESSQVSAEQILSLIVQPGIQHLTEPCPNVSELTSGLDAQSAHDFVRIEGDGVVSVVDVDLMIVLLVGQHFVAADRRKSFFRWDALAPQRRDERKPPQVFPSLSPGTPIGLDGYKSQRGGVSANDSATNVVEPSPK